MKKLKSYDFSSIFCDFRNSKNTLHCSSQPSYKENGPSWSVTSAREALESCRVKRLQIRGHRGIVQRKQLLQCLIGVLLRIAVMWRIFLNVYLCKTYLSLAIKQRFPENTTGQVGTDSINSFPGTCLDENW